MRSIGAITVLNDDGVISSELAGYLERVSRIPEYTTAQLTAKESQVNRDKSLGKKITNITTGRTLYGGGNDLTSPWVDGSGVTVHTVI